MKLLEISAKGMNSQIFPNAGNKIKFSMLPDAKLPKKDILLYGDELSFININDSIYLHTIQAIIGANATGKTTFVELLVTLGALINNDIAGLQQISFLKRVSYDDVMEIKVSYYNEKDNNIYQYENSITRNENDLIQVQDEKIYKKKFFKSKMRSKKDLLDFSNPSDYQVLTKEALAKIIDGKYNVSLEQSTLLSLAGNIDNTSIVAYAANSVQSTIYQGLNFQKKLESEFKEKYTELQMSIIRMLDSKIVDFGFDMEKEKFHVEFSNLKSYQNLSYSDLCSLLSDGTIKGLTLFNVITEILREGQLLVVDEIETHFSKAIVDVIVGLFYDKRINKNGAQLIFTTHYAELLDDISRNDAVYITDVEYTGLLKSVNKSIERQELKKSQQYIAGKIGSKPKYENIEKLKMVIESAV